MSSVKKTKMLLSLVLVFVTALLMMIGLQVKNNVYADDTTVKTVSEVTFTMEKGANIYNNPDVNKKGIRFGATLSETEYAQLMRNVGADKVYSGIKFGVIIAPADYESKYGAFDKKNLFGEGGTAVYDWAIWDDELGWQYNGNKIRVVNIEKTKLDVNGGVAPVYGALTTILDINLLTEFKGVAYIIGEKNSGGYDIEFATENDNVMTPVYIAQRVIQMNKEILKDLDEVADAEYIAELEASNAKWSEYITDDVKAQTAEYTVEHYYAKPDKSGYFLYETTKESGNIDATLSVANVETNSSVVGVEFDAENSSNAADPVIYAQDKSIVKVYYNVAYGTNNTDNVFDINQTEDYAIDSANIIKLYSADMAEIAITDGKVANETVVAMGKGEHTVYALTENGFVACPVINATHVLSTADEFVSFFKDSLTNANSNSSVNWYVALACDIDVSGKTFPSMGSSWFVGTFNGLGHVVNGYTPKDAYGLFGAVKAQATVKNLALTNVTNTEWNTLSHDFSGTLDNVYVQGEITAASTWRGVANVKSASAKISNVIVNISGFARPAFQCSAEPIITNSYAIGDKLTGFIGIYGTNQGNAPVYETVSEFYTAEINDITSANSFNKYWSKTAVGLYFGNALVALNPNIQPTETKATEYIGLVDVGTTGAVSGTKDYTINLAEMLGNKTPGIILLDGTQVDIADSITLNSGDYEYGTEHTIIFGAGETIIEQPFMFATHVIKTADDMVDFFNSYSLSASTTNANYNGTDTWYAVVANDVDMNDLSEGKAFVGKTTSDYYGGKFNGLGHVISNLTVKGDQGLFGYTAKYVGIYNLAFVNVNAGAKSVLTNYLNQYGVASNIYIQGTGSTSGTRGAIKVAGGTISNCIVDMTSQQYGYTYNDNWGTIKNSYAVNTTKFSNHSTTPGTPHVSIEALFNDATFIADISAGSTNGWAEYWNLTGDATNGYTLKFSNVIVGTTVQA